MDIPRSNAHRSPIDEWYWNAEPEAEPVAERVVEVADDFVDAAGNRIRVPQDIDIDERNDINIITNSNRFQGNREIVQHFPNGLRYMNFKYADFRNVDFNGVDLSGSNLFGAQLDGAIFTRANLTGVNFQWTDLMDVDFTGATFGGDYAAGGLLEGATIERCLFDNTILAERYDYDTTIKPYDPVRPQMGPIPAQNTVNINEMAYDVEAEEENTQIVLKNYLADPAHQNQNIIIRVYYGGKYDNYVMSRTFVDTQMANNQLTVYPCTKPFNTPGPVDPAPGQRTYHDRTVVLENIGRIIKRKLLVYQDAWNQLLLEPGNIFIFSFTDQNSQTVPTLVSHEVLFNGAGWVGNHHCNDGAERETIAWAVKTNTVDEPLPLPVAEDMLENAFATTSSSPAAFQGDYIDPYADASDSEEEEGEGEGAAAAPPRPMIDTSFLNVDGTAFLARKAPDTVDAVGNNIIGKMTIVNQPVPIRSQIDPSVHLTTIVLRVVDLVNNVDQNYLIKYNDMIKLYPYVDEKIDKVYPCTIATPEDAVGVIDRNRQLFNIGTFIGRIIYVDKKKFLSLFVKERVRVQRTYIVKRNEQSEIVYGIVPLKEIREDVDECNKSEQPIVVWELDEIPNNFHSEQKLKYNVGDKVVINRGFGMDSDKKPVTIAATIVAIPEFNEEFIETSHDMDDDEFNMMFLEPFSKYTPEFKEHFRVNKHALIDYDEDFEEDEQHYFLKVESTDLFPLGDYEFAVNIPLFVSDFEIKIYPSFKKDDIVNVKMNEVEMKKCLIIEPVIGETYNNPNHTRMIIYSPPVTVEQYYLGEFFPETSLSIIMPNTPFERVYFVQTAADENGEYNNYIIDESNLSLAPAGPAPAGGDNIKLNILHHKTRNRHRQHHHDTLRKNINYNIHAKKSQRHKFKHRNNTQKHKS